MHSDDELKAGLASRGIGISYNNIMNHMKLHPRSLSGPETSLTKIYSLVLQY